MASPVHYLSLIQVSGISYVKKDNGRGSDTMKIGCTVSRSRSKSSKERQGSDSEGGLVRGEKRGGHAPNLKEALIQAAALLPLQERELDGDNL